MAELTKKLQVKVSGTTTPCKIYSTSAEAGTSYVRAKVDNVEAYIPLVAASDGRASKVHIGSKCIATTGKPPYTEKSWTTAGTYTFTVPSGVTRLRIAVCGGGSGSTGESRDKPSGAGGTSSFGNLIQATGGTAAKAYYSDGSKTEGGKGGTPNGRDGSGGSGYVMQNGGIGFALQFTLANGSYGNGGSIKDVASRAAQAGGSGGYNSNYINVESGVSYSIKVGAGGSAGYKGSAGNSGFVLIAFGGDI